MNYPLVPTMFHDPEPRKEDYYNTGKLSSQQFDHERFEKDHRQWTRRRVKPEPEWVSFEDKQPKGNPFYMAIHPTNDPDEMLTRVNYPLTKTWDMMKYWADKETYDKELEYYEANRLRFKGDGNFFVTFLDDNEVSICYKSAFNEIYSGPCDVQLLRNIYRLRNVELEEI